MAGEETVYRVRTVYETETAGAERGITSLGGVASSVAGMMTGAFDRVVSTLTHPLTAALAGGGIIGAGIAALRTGLTQLNAGAEEAQIAIAGMMNAGGAVDTFEGSLQVSDRIIQQMRVHARELPGEFQDLMNVFQGGLMGGLAAQRTSEQIEHLSAQFMAVSQTFHVESQAAGRELAMMLEGRAGSHVVMWSRMSALIGKSATEFNAMTNAQRFDAISRALRGFDPAIERYGHSWSAVTSTAHDHLTDMLRVGTAPLFDKAKEALGRLNEYFEHNEASIMRTVRLVGERLANAFTRVSDIVERLFGRVRGLVDTVRNLNLSNVMGTVGNSLLSGGLMRAGLGAIAGGSLGLGAGVLLPMATAVASGDVNTGKILRDLRDAAMPLVGALKEFWDAIKPLVSLVGQVLITALTNLIQELTSVITGIMRFATTIANAVGSIARLFGASTGVAPEGMSDTEADARGLSRDSSSVWGSIRSQMATGNLYRELQNRGDELGAGIILNGMQLSENNLSDNIPSAFRNLAHGVNTGRNPEHRVRTPAQHPSGHMTVHVRIEQTINDASDPDRVLVQTRRAIQQSLQHPVESPNYVIPGR